MKSLQHHKAALVAVLVVFFGFFATMAEAKPTNADLAACKNAALTQNHLSETAARHLVAGTELIINGHKTPMVHHVWGTCEQQLSVHAVPATAVAPKTIVPSATAKTIAPVVTQKAQPQTKTPAQVAPRVSKETTSRSNFFGLVPLLLIAAFLLAIIAILFSLLYLRLRKTSATKSTHHTRELAALQREKDRIEKELAESEGERIKAKRDLAQAEKNLSDYRHAYSRTHFTITFDPLIMDNSVARTARFQMPAVKVVSRDTTIKDGHRTFERLVQLPWSKEKFRLCTIYPAEARVDWNEQGMLLELEKDHVTKWFMDRNAAPLFGWSDWKEKDGEDRRVYFNAVEEAKTSEPTP